MEEKKHFKISVVMPIYNVEKYLEEAIKSVIGQTIGFEDNIQLILVNDGSPDRSDLICRNYQDQYPDNIIYIEKDNGGVSSARNLGMKCATGEFINFMDSDDYWDRSAFELILKFSEKHPGINVISGRSLFADRLEGTESYYDFVYEKTRVVNILETYDLPVHSVNKNFFRNSSIQDFAFDESITFMEDQLFTSSVLIKEKSFGVVREAEYYYRKRFEQDSVCDVIKDGKEYFITTPKKVLLEIISLSEKEFGSVLPYYQHMLNCYLRVRFRRLPPEQLSSEEMEQQLSLLKEVVSYIDDYIIIDQRKIPLWYKIYELRVKYGNEEYERKNTLHKELLHKVNLRINSVIERDSFIIAEGPAHEKWISDKCIVYAVDEKGNRFKSDYTRVPEKDHYGLYPDIVIDEYKRVITLPARDGARYEFFISYDGNEDRQLKTIYGRNARSSHIDLSNYSIKKNGDTEEKRFVDAIAEKTHIPIETAFEEMNATRLATGISYADYYKNKLYEQEMHERVRLAAKIVKKKEQNKKLFLEVSEYTDLSLKEVRARYRDIRQKYKGVFLISPKIYHDYELYRKDEPELKNTISLLAERKKLNASFQSIYNTDINNIDCISSATLEGIFLEIKDICAGLITETIEIRCCEAFSKRYPQMLSDINTRKNIAIDFTSISGAAGYNAIDYLMYDLYGKKLSEKLSYVSSNMFNNEIRDINPEEFRSLLDDKSKCYAIFHRYYRRSLTEVKKSGFNLRYRLFCLLNRSFVKKPMYAKQGEGIRMVSVNEYRSIEDMINSILLENGPFIAEGVVLGHEKTQQFNHDSLNTLRIITFNTGKRLPDTQILKDAEDNGILRYAGDGIYCLAALFKTGRKGTFVDNGGAGGLFCAVDLSTGRGSRFASGEDGSEVEVHPDSGIRYDSLEFEKIDEAVDMAREMALLTPEIKIIGWDLAFTDREKWVAIEGNFSPTLLGQAPAQYGIYKAFCLLISAIKIEVKEV